MRTQEEIVKRISERKKNDMFGWEFDGYIRRLDYEHAKPFFEEDCEKRRLEARENKSRRRTQRLYAICLGKSQWLSGYKC